ncbi:hypothetical protein AVEN_171393-1 [Araneus ventricosus]|uniref:Uncharacterized protein n=1 Tax=Araneus ventricosus TaxID=182803 RepID=A0A4Y2FIA1_ARAVE|nr:hypothetical protein AVEN_171393-1 [Araneus ventricosus]
MESENYIFTDNSMDSNDKLTALRQQSQASHINRIRFAIEKRKRIEPDRFHYGQPKISNNRSSNVTSKKRTYRENFSNKNVLNEPRSSDDNGNNRFLTLHVNNPFHRYSEHSGDMGHGVDDTTNTQSGIHVISTSCESNNGRSKKSRKQWAKTTKPVSEFTMSGQENTAERNGGHGYSEKNLPVENIQEFDGIQNERNVESLEYVENNMAARLPATEKIANVVQWIESLPPPESGEPTLEPVPYGISEERNEFHQSSGEYILIKQVDSPKDSAIVGRDTKGTKNSKKSPRKVTKQTRNVSGLSKTKPKEYKDKKGKMEALLKKAELSNRIGLKTPKDDPLKVAYTPRGNLKVIVCLKDLKPKDTALLVWLGDFKHSMHNEENTTSPRKVKRGSTYLNDQQMEFFESIFKNKNATGDDRSE